MTYFFWTYLARFLGILLIIPSLFPSLFYNRFPGLEDRRVAWILFGVGVAVYALASIVFHILRKREQERKREQPEEL
jgi:predicted membrane channel-forming protein YqfA (hemolysin III family)